MKNYILVALIACGGTFVVAAEPSSALPRSSPEAQGIPSSAILAFVEAADRNIDAMHSVMLLRHGHVVTEGWWSPYNAGIASLAVFAEQELHLHRRRPGGR